MRWINGKLSKVITDENDNIIKNPNDEQIKMSILDNRRKKRKRTNFEKRICCICGSDHTDKNVLDCPIWINHKCDKIDCTKYVCHSCHKKIQYRSFSSGYYIAQWRIGELDPSSPSGKGFIGQQIVAKRYGIEDCNLKMDNFHFYVDLSKIPGLGYAEVKTASYDIEQAKWPFSNINKENFDILLLLCMDAFSPWRDVERVYMIPDEYAESTGISINRYPSRLTYMSKEKFRIDRRPFNDIYHNMKLENCKVLKKQI